MIDLASPGQAMAGRPTPDRAQLFCIGISHRRASFEIREGIALGPAAEETLAKALQALPGLAEFFLLCTCNRLELYGVARSGDVVAQARALFGYAIGLSEEGLQALSETWRDFEVVRHLVEVAVGIDSQLVGETEIFGQLKRAYEKAHRAGTTGRVLNQLAQRSFHLAKEVRTATSIGAGHLSLGSQVAQAGRRAFGELAQTAILVIGCGEIGRKVARALHAGGARRLTLCNRTEERAAELAAELTGAVLPFQGFEGTVGEFDLVVAATSSHGFVLRAAVLESALARRNGRPTLLFDLAMPRNIEPPAGPGGILHNLETLSLGTEASRSARMQAARECQGLIASRSALLWDRLAGGLPPASP